MSQRIALPLLILLMASSPIQAKPKAETHQAVATTCPDVYKEFLGKWEGDFEAYDRVLKGFRPYHNIVVYSEADCQRDPKSGDVFIIGRRVDTYPAFKGLPAKVEEGQLITGMSGGDASRPFLRTIDSDGVTDYAMVYKNPVANLSVWKTHVPSSDKSPEMTLTVLDGKDHTVKDGHRRLVTITLQVGPTNKPSWEGVVTRGSHSKSAR